MGKNVVIIGAGGHGKVVADIIQRNGDTVMGFLDDNYLINSDSLFVGLSILGKIDDYKKFKDSYFVIAIGNAWIRYNISKQLFGVKWYKAIHPNAVISNIDTYISEGTVIMANVVVNAGSRIGKHCILNSGAIIEHDDIIDDYAHISVGAKLAGAVHIGKYTWVGIGATVSNNITVCENCMIGAGTLVVKDIFEPGTYIGVPAKKLNYKD